MGEFVWDFFNYPPQSRSRDFDFLHPFSREQRWALSTFSSERREERGNILTHEKGLNWPFPPTNFQLTWRFSRFYSLSLSCSRSNNKFFFAILVLYVIKLVIRVAQPSFLSQEKKKLRLRVEWNSSKKLENKHHWKPASNSIESFSLSSAACIEPSSACSRIQQRRGKFESVEVFLNK